MVETDSARTIHATGPHCGVCAHVTFQDDWDRTPYCTHRGEPVAIEVGDVCEAFER